ncbi:MAG: UDP-N-acetylmuramoyl-tripeptide--D-alanyl-D-alanine ligase [Thermoanaerobacteraceae bacterium]|nr:UDP-N-acetylmuramoyl-tripeptide--D-alanyl-D-alanine ligase [Thermoanaerobacteraceae bacterium]
MLSLNDVLAATNGRLVNNISNNLSFTGVSIDSRNVESGMLFIPLSGDRFDGHDFIQDASNNGAIATLTQYDVSVNMDNFLIIRVEDTLKALQDLSRYIRRKFDRVKIIAITGSTGKTTTKNFVTSVLSERYKVLSNKGNYNNQIGLPLTLINLDGSYDIAVLEMGMNSFGEIRNLSDIARQDIAVITNIGTAHIGNLGSRENILRAKLEITEFLNKDNTAYFNGDDDLLSKVNGLYKVLYFGFENNNDIQAFDIKNNKEDGMEFNIKYKNYQGHFVIRLPGKHNIMNALPAIALGYDFGLKWEEIYDGLLKTKNEKMRLKLININSMRLIDDTYNANPDSMKAAINFLVDVSMYSRKVAILGDMLELGEFAVQSHKDIGKYCYISGVDVLITYGNMAKYIAEGAVSSGMNPNDVYYFEDKAELKKNLSTIIKSDDIVLVKGSRGMKMDEIAEYLGEK